ncbi:hypothetical protein [Nostoc sp.]
MVSTIEKSFQIGRNHPIFSNAIFSNKLTGFLTCEKNAVYPTGFYFLFSRK